MSSTRRRHHTRKAHTGKIPGVGPASKGRVGHGSARVIGSAGNIIKPADSDPHTTGGPNMARFKAPAPKHGTDPRLHTQSKSSRIAKRMLVKQPKRGPVRKRKVR